MPKLTDISDFLLIFLYDTAMLLSGLIIIYPHQDGIALIAFQCTSISPLMYLLQGCISILIPLQLYEYGRLIRMVRQWQQHYIRKAFPCWHFPDCLKILPGTLKCQTYHTAQRIFIIILKYGYFLMGLIYTCCYYIILPIQHSLQ